MQQNKKIVWPNVMAPVAAIYPHVRKIHDDTVQDDYYWMIDYFKKGEKSQEVIDYLEEENNYTNLMLQDTEDLQESLFHELKSRIKEKDESVPYYKNGYFYYSRTEEGKQYFKFCRKKGTLEGEEEVLLDVDQLAEGHAYYTAKGFSVSPDNRLLAFSVDTVSRREYTIFIKNIETGEIYPDQIKNTEGAAIWGNDNRTLFYTAKNPVTLLSEKIMRHTLGGDPAADVLVYEEKDNTNYIGVGKSKNGKYVMINSEGTLSSEIWLLNADSPQSEFRIFQPRIQDVLYSVVALEDRFLILTNDGAINFRIMQCPLDRTDRSHWQPFIDHRPDVLVSDIEEFKDFLAIAERKNGLTQLAIYNLKSQHQHYLDFGEVAYTVYPGINVEYNSDKLRYGYTSLVTPSSVYEYDMAKQKKILLKQQEILGGYDQTAYITERVFATARDGVQVPISIVYKKGTKLDGSAPLLQYAYGSYGASMDPTFSSNRLSLLDREFIYALAHIRGGEEMGRQWYEDGKMMHKMNTFYDFVDCGKYLIDQHYCMPEHLYAQGGSAGGLLMGVIANIAPEQYHGIIAQVPFVDVVNTMLDDTIPLTTNEYDEWGNPNEKEAYYYMKAYSPYENIEAKEYPNLLVTTGLHDSQVQYFEPAKWVAKLRATKIGDAVLLLKTDMDYGHGGASGRFDYLKEIALEYAFLFKLEGIIPIYTNE
ncbi:MULTISPECIES: S9 family peptidase [Sphingobacterium]|uniref:Proline-specific endopeptidase n=2 Tax=Sphingobacterium TaxID=28453 RepID=A0A654BSF7_SPHMU|nr:MULTISPECIES: S9 family peptidase [Sphingobacterium]HAE66673.1 oligopeptidase B [Sphingobacterium sp.]QQT43965.1 S9 family peptidase [Sphingobacterium multivorum]QQT63283.1 S9 family peptidase [Sphingobacterium multivorum]TWI23820.1 oligopeptidase B [Sphingobacterium siyangense]SUJ07556.1 Protease 2 [Sphingobacterium multivorum]